MQQTLSYSSSPSPTPISTITQPARPPSRPASTASVSASATAKAAPAIISVDYSFDRSGIMSPSAHSTSNYNDRSRAPSEVLYADKASFNQPYNSLFGDPVPPPQPEDYFGTAAFETIRAGSVDVPSSEEDTLLAAVALNTLIGNDGRNRRRLFSDVPYTNISSSTCRSLLPIPRPQPPDIQILPNSSGGSSSEQLDSPNFLLLAPQDIVNKPAVYELEYEQASQEQAEEQAGRQSRERPMSESYSSTGLADWYRPTSQHFAEFSRIPKLRPSSKMVMSMKHDEMPLSPLATMLQDSNGSSSGGEEQLPIAVEEQQLSRLRSPVPNPIPTPPMDMNIILSPKQYLQQQKRQFLETYKSPRSPKMPRTSRSPSHSVSQVAESGNEMSITSTEAEVRLQGEMSPVVIKDSVSTGGDYRVGETRLHKKSSFTILSVRSPKSSLSHSPSTTPVRQQRLRNASIQSTTTSSTAAQLPTQLLPPQQQRMRRKSLAGSRLPQLPPAVINQLATDDSPRPSVQFNMSGGGYSPSKLAMPTKGILQQRDSLTSSVDTYTPRAQRRASTFGQRIKSLETLPLITDPYRSAIPRFHRSAMELDKEPAVIPPGPLPRPLKPNPNPTRKQRGLLGVINRGAEQPPPPPPQPRSNWLSLDDLVLETRLAKSGLDTMRLQARRRSSSTSPERRSSTQTASDRRSSNLSSITTSDFSFRRPSLSTLPATTSQRRKSVYLPTKSPRRRQSIVAGRDQQPSKRAKIAKPSTLSPIIGTPNKDTPQSPLHGSAYDAAHRDTPSDLSMRRDSVSRIPVRNRLDLSQHNSRSNSPLKDLNSLSLLSGRNSQESNSRSPSQATIRSSIDVHGNQLDSRLTPTRFHTRSPTSRGPTSRPGSRMAVQDTNSRRNSLANSLINSRANSRADSRANSRADSRANSRAGSRANSRAESRANSRADSRANSRLSVRSSLRSTSISPATMMRNSRIADATPSRRKSISTSPTSRAVRKMSLSPGERPAKRSPQKRDSKEASSTVGERRNSRSRIPRSTSISRVKSSSPTKKQAKPTEKSRSPKGKRTAVGPAKLSAKEKPNKAESAKKKNTLSGKAEASAKRSAAKTPSRVPSKKQSPSQAKTPQQQQQKKQDKDAGKEKTDGKGAGKADKSTTKPSGTNGQPKTLTRQGSQLQNQAKRGNNESNAATKAKQKTSPEKVEQTKEDAKASGDSINPLAVQVGNAVLQAAEVLPAVRNEVNASTATGAIKRQGSNMSTLVRMSSRLSLISNKKRVDSAQQRKVATVQEQPQETEVSKGHAALTAQSTSGDGVAQAQATSSDGIANAPNAAETGQPKTINETSSDPKSHESESGIISEHAAMPSPSGTKATPPVLPASHDSTARLDTADGSNAQRNSGEMMQKSPLPPTQPIEAAISVLNATATDAATAAADELTGQSVSTKPELDSERANAQEQHALELEHATPTTGSRDDFLVDDKRLSPDGQGGSTAGSGGNAKTGSQEFLKEDAGKGGVCRCCSKLCMRFRRSRCMRCCGRRQDRLHGSVEEQPVLSSARSSATTTTTQLEVIDETKKHKKSSCWPTSTCCKSCQRKPKTSQEPKQKQTNASTMSEEPMHQSVPHPSAKQQGKCGLCLTKIFCCRSVNKVDPRTGDETELRKCCFCIPCRRKRGAVASSADPKVAWRDRDPEVGITATDAAIVEGSSVAPSAASPRDDASKMSCCRRFWLMLFCCRKKPRRGSDARRQSIKAPPTSEETRRKLHNDLVEYTSKMKGAIPVLPLYLAWFCAFCNVIFPGLGTLLSGLFCLCVGIPRFSQFDSARARIGSFIINIIVAVAQFFCVLFCFVGWGWSIWWGTIMLKCAKKLSKIKKVERLELEEEQRQADLAAAASAGRGETEPAKT